ncbi:MAG: hypothetical protein JEZ07_18150 [Phycisphaerae bacterium]|nr:hypothetical protein [Phycisphaerae bacterium]
MKRFRNTITISTAFFVMIFAGCIPTRQLKWAPDGSMAAIQSKNGVLFCDSAGLITDFKIPNATVIDWCPDSKSLYAVTSEEISTWDQLKDDYLDKNKILQINRYVKEIQTRFFGKTRQELESANKYFTEKAEALTKQQDYQELFYLTCAIMQVRDSQKDKVKPLLTEKEWKDIEKISLIRSQLSKYTIKGNQIIAGATIWEDFDGIFNIVSNPNGSAVLIWSGTGQLIAVCENGKSRVISQHANALPAWSPIGQDIVYIESNINSGMVDSPKQLGNLIKEKIFDGQDLIADKNVDSDKNTREILARVMFSPIAQIKFLNDDKIIFSSTTTELPAIADADEKINLFSLSHYGSISIKPMLTEELQLKLKDYYIDLFILSPDQKNIAIVGHDGQVALLDIKTKELKMLQDRKIQKNNLLPSWRSNDELTFAIPGKIVLYNIKTASQKILSDSWPASLQDYLLKPE